MMKFCVLFLLGGGLQKRLPARHLQIGVALLGRLLPCDLNITGAPDSHPLAPSDWELRASP